MKFRYGLLATTAILCTVGLQTALFPGWIALLVFLFVAIPVGLLDVADRATERASPSEDGET